MKRMSSNDRKILRDLMAFIDYGIREDMDLGLVLATVAHDVGGILRNDKCFLPRSHDYSIKA
jgi:hypothetical protein